MFNTSPKDRCGDGVNFLNQMVFRKNSTGKNMKEKTLNMCCRVKTLVDFCSVAELDGFQLRYVDCRSTVLGFDSLINHTKSGG